MSTATPLITIAIPTYNRLEILTKTLNMLALQDGFDDDDIEIVVSDNASEIDPTPILRAFEQRHNRSLVIHRNVKNEGIDGNIHQVTELAQGRFVLLMSDDDILFPGTLRLLRTIVEDEPNLLFCFVNAVPFWGDYNSETLTGPTVVPLPKTLHTNSADEFVATIGVWATFISSFFFRRQAWIDVADRCDYIGTDIYLTHVLYRLLAMHPDQPKIVTAERLVAARMEYTGNFRIFYAFAQQFMRLICIDAPKLGFNKAFLRRVKLRTIRASLPGMVMMVRRARTSHGLSISELRMLLQYIWWEPCMYYSVLPVALLPLGIVSRLVELRRSLRGLARRLII
nr:glycosyltransferase family 2 protein [Chromobacterium sp. ASV5]